MEDHKQDARQDAIDMVYYVTSADRNDATKFVDLMIAACGDSLASRLDKLDACVIKDCEDIETLVFRACKLEEGRSSHGMQIDSLDAQQSSQHEELAGVYRRLNNLELLGKGLTETASSHSRQINALRARTDGIEPGSGKQADAWEDSPIAADPNRSPERLIGIIADLHLHLADILGALERRSDASGILKMECGKDSFLQWRRLASKACDNAKVVL